MTRIWAVLIGAASFAIAGAAAAEPPKGKGPGGGGPEQHGGGQGHAKHQHHQHNGHDMIKAALKQDGKHAVGKFKTREVTAEVKHGKVVAMNAGDLAGKRVRTKQKMAMGPEGLIQAAWTGGGLQLAQFDSYYYGYCFDDGIDYDCYWYPAEDVDYASYAWDDYDPYY